MKKIIINTRRQIKILKKDKNKTLIIKFMKITIMHNNTNRDPNKIKRKFNC